MVITPDGSEVTTFIMKHILNAANLKHLKPKEGRKLTKYHDGEGLYLWVYDDGKKSYKRWFFRYRFNKKSRPELLLGTFPKVSAAEAREKADDARKLLAQGIDPAIDRKEKKQEAEQVSHATFKAIALEWYEKQTADYKPDHRKTIMTRLEQDVFPFIGDKQINELKGPDFLSVAQRVEMRGAIDLAKRILGYCSNICDYGVLKGKCEYDPCKSVKKGLSKKEAVSRAAVTEPEEVAGIIRAIGNYSGTFVVACALKFAPLVFVRPGELRHAQWKDIDLENNEWRYKVAKTQKTGVKEHIVPLSRQAKDILLKLKEVTGHSKYVFPSPRSSDRPMSNNGILAAFRRLGITKEEMCCHGWRATARTMLEERLEYPAHLIEHQLAHTVKDPNGRAYNRTTHLEKRREMMQAWADYLDSLKVLGVSNNAKQE